MAFRRDFTWHNVTLDGAMGRPAGRFDIAIAGYNRDQVDQYVARVQRALAELSRIETVLANAEQLAAEMVSQARAEADEIVAKASARADAVIADAQQRAGHLTTLRRRVAAEVLATQRRVEQLAAPQQPDRQ